MTIRSTPNRGDGLLAVWLGGRGRRRSSTAATAFFVGVDNEPGAGVIDDLAHGAASVGDHRCCAAMEFDNAEPERLIEVDQVEQGVGSAE